MERVRGKRKRGGGEVGESDTEWSNETKQAVLHRNSKGKLYNLEHQKICYYYVESQPFKIVTSGNQTTFRKHVHSLIETQRLWRKKGVPTIENWKSKTKCDYFSIKCTE